ncbi:hypothetical protein [Synechococcus phage BUCT-ZZ01]|nr:hypothetical protein [Synechococcus phage BUCT-ZZ01]
MRHYDNRQLQSIEDFNEDLRRFSFLNALFTRYSKKKELRLNLILNHIVVICNVFGVQGAPKLLFYKINKEYHQALGTILLFLNIVEYIDSDIDEYIQDELEKI